MPVLLIPTPLRPFTENLESVTLKGETIGEVLSDLTARFSALRQHLYAEDGKLRSYVNIYVNDEDIRNLDKEKTAVQETDVVSIIPSIAGGVENVLRTVGEEIQLSNDEVMRYSRHLIIPQVGMEGQKLLKASKVLIVGAGGLGSPLALYLAAAGIGQIGIVDFDVVDLTNLQRQILHSTGDIGKSKLESARESIHGINPHVNVCTYRTRLDSGNALQLFEEYDIIADGTDNFPTRYLINDACVLLGKPNVYGSIYRFDGQVTVFDAGRGPCYRCLYPSPPPPDLIPSCAEGGVLGVLPGIIGSLQALETMKLILGQGDLLIGRLVLFDAMKFTFREFKLRKNADCPICGDTPTIHELIDYEQFCGMRPSVKSEPEQQSDRISVEELKNRIDRREDLFLLDVREPHEFEIVNLGGSLIPLGELPKRYREVDGTKEIVVICKVGGRSARAVEFMKKQGYSRVKNLVGGIDRWAEKIDPSMPRY